MIRYGGTMCWYGAVVRCGEMAWHGVARHATVVYGGARARRMWYEGMVVRRHGGMVEDGGTKARGHGSGMSARWHGGTVVRWYVGMVVHESTMDR